MPTVTGGYFYSVVDTGDVDQYTVVGGTGNNLIAGSTVTATEDENSGNSVNPDDEVVLEFSDPADQLQYGGTYVYKGYVLGEQGNQWFMRDSNANYFVVGINPAGSSTLEKIEASAPLCFLAGTMIAVPGGAKAVEQLAIGDTILTASGETRAVRWIGRQGVAALFAAPLRAYPVRIAAGALAENVPARDLFVSPSHGVMVDGLLAEAASLVNGTSITRVAEPEQHFTWYHIETEDHAVILAEGTAVESFVDNATRANFDNYAEFLALHGEPDAAIAEMGAPRVQSARQLPAHIREELELRAHALGLASKQAA